MGLEPDERARLILAHQPTMAADIRVVNRRKPSFDTLPRQGCIPRYEIVVGGTLGERANRV